jgi:hypothetical protein
MEHQFYLVPIKGLLVRAPDKSVLPEIGAYKTKIGPEGRFWRRRINDGSVIVSTPKQAARKVERSRFSTAKKEE